MKQFGLTGYPLSHSFSKKYFAEKFLRENIQDCAYDNYPLGSIGDLPGLLRDHPDLCGLNVTIPYKETVLPMLDTQSPVVTAIQACNCIVIRNGRLHGHNTDVIGFERSLLPKLKEHHDKALVLGTGGSAKAVAWVMEKMGIPYRYVSRKPVAGGLTYADLNPSVMEQYHLIINTTPLGMFPETGNCPDIPYAALGNRHYCFDLVYNPDETLFLKKAAAQGALIKNGADMLAIQAEESWDIWMSAQTPN